MRSPQSAILALIELQRDASRALDREALLARIGLLSSRTLELADAFIDLARAESQTLKLVEVDLIGLVLDAARNEVPAARRFERLGRAAEGEVVGLGAAAREDDLRRFRADQRADLGARLVQARLRALAEMMDARRVAEILRQHARHRLGHLRRHGGRRVVIEVDTHLIPQ